MKKIDSSKNPNLDDFAVQLLRVLDTNQNQSVEFDELYEGLKKYFPQF